MPEEYHHFEIDPEVLDLLQSAILRRNDPGVTLPLTGGDLQSLAKQKQLLQRQGMLVGQCDVYPSICPEDYPRALEIFFKHRPEGWSNYGLDMIEHKICTADELAAAIDAELEES